MSATSTWEPVRVIAGIAWKRLWRGRTIWVVGLLVILPILYAAAGRLAWESRLERWHVTAHFALRLNVLLASALLLAVALTEEIEARTYTWLWSRPVPRTSVLFGKALVAVPLLIAAFAASFTLAYLLATDSDAIEHKRFLGRALLAVGAVVITSSALSLGLGTLFRGHPVVAVLALLLGVDQALSFLPSVGNLSIARHAYGIAGSVPPAFSVEPPLTSALWLLGMTIVWLAIAVWRVNRSELGTADS